MFASIKRETGERRSLRETKMEPNSGGRREKGEGRGYRMVDGIDTNSMGREKKWMFCKEILKYLFFFFLFFFFRCSLSIISLT